MPTAPSSITAPPLVVRFGAVGDMVMTTPLLRALAARHGQPCDVLGRGTWLPAVLARVPFVRQVRHIDSLHWPPWWLSLRKRAVIRWLCRRGEGPVYLLQSDRDTRRLLAPAHLAITAVNEQIEQRATEHTCDRFLRLGAFPAGTPRGCELAVGDDEMAEVDRWLAGIGIAGAPVVLIQPGNRRTRRVTTSSRDTKIWPEERWIATIRGVLAQHRDVRVLVIGAPKEQPLAQALVHGVADPRVRAVADQLPMRRLFALLKRAHSLISVDTGPAHAAAALGCPVVGLFGTTDPRVTGPCSLGSPVLPVIPPAARSLGPTEGWPAGLGLDQVPVDDVLAAWCGLLAATLRLGA
jgi:heptosyltransferase-2/heptosyltransferase-3